MVDPVVLPGLDEVLSLITRASRRALGATGAGVLFPQPGGIHEVRGADIGRGFVPRSRTLFALARDDLVELASSPEQRTLHLDGDLIAVEPVGPRGEAPSFLGIWFNGRSRSVDQDERALITVFADQASMALSFTGSVQHREQVVVRGERDRMARELHDVVIQRLFASGLSIRALSRSEDLEAIRRGLAVSVDQLDRVIDELRAAIFDLKHERGTRLGEEVAKLVSEYARTLGFRPTVRTEGDLDAGVEGHVAGHLLATMRELLSNVVRHAQAGACLIEVVLRPGELCLRITDDGTGIDGEAPHSGLENARLRAALLGGTFHVEPHPRAGTIASWRVPPGRPLRESSS